MVSVQRPVFAFRKEPARVGSRYGPFLSEDIMLKSQNHTQIPNEFLDEYLHKVSQSATKVFLVICRKTFGWHKKTDRISFSQLSDATGLSNSTCQLAVAELEELDLISKTIEGAGRASSTYYSIKYDDPIQGDGTDNIPKIGTKEAINVPKIGNTKEKNINKVVESPKGDTAVQQFCQEYSDKYRTNVIITNVDAINLTRIKKKVGEEEYSAKLKKYFAEDAWYTNNGRSPTGFYRHYNEIIIKKPRDEGAPKRVCKYCGGVLLGTSTLCKSCGEQQ